MIFRKYVIPTALVFLFILYQPNTPQPLPRPPTLPPKPQRMRKSRPRSIFNRKLFNGNMEAFIQVLAPLWSLSLHELNCLASGPSGVSLPLASLFPRRLLTHTLSSCSLPCLHRKTDSGGNHSDLL